MIYLYLTLLSVWRLESPYQCSSCRYQCGLAWPAVMSGRVWHCEMILAREVRGGGYREVWGLCTATMYRTRPRLALETDPFSLENYKTVLQINSDLVVSFKSPIARDFRLYFKSKTQVKLSKNI